MDQIGITHTMRCHDVGQTVDHRYVIVDALDEVEHPVHAMSIFAPPGARVAVMSSGGAASSVAGKACAGSEGERERLCGLSGSPQPPGPRGPW